MEDRETAKIFGANLNFIMFAKDMSTKELSIATGVTRQSIYNYRTGRALPRVDLAVRFAELLGVDIQALFQGVGAETDHSAWHFADIEPPKDGKYVIAWCQGGVSELLRYDSETGLWMSPIPYRCYTKDYVIKWEYAPAELEGSPNAK